ncbi:MAG: class II glutamine amidotransferase [Pseudomonadota bacterium]
MCQLLGMNANVPTDICFSFEGFHHRGGRTDHHRDGWGIAFFEGAGVRLFIDSRATIDSPVADFVRSYPIRSLNVIAHIRRATRGPVALVNTHPFTRELWGRYWAFAHNGTLKEFAPRLQGRYRPVGQTDSELAFCWMLETLRRLFPRQPPPLGDLCGALRDAARELSRFGVFNFLLSNGDVLFAHCSDHLWYVVRKAPFGTAHLVDDDLSVDFSSLTGPDDRVAVIATQPLTDNEAWAALAPGELKVFHHGDAVPL